MSFTSTKEIYQSLIQGETVQDTYKNTVYLDAITGNQVVTNGYGKICKEVAYKFDNPDDWMLYEKQINISVIDLEKVFSETFQYYSVGSKDVIISKIIDRIYVGGFIK